MLNNLVSFETPPIRRNEILVNTTMTATATAAIRGNEEGFSNTCFHGHLDLSLGISLSHGGSSCDASSCGGNKQESYGAHRQGSRDNKDDVRCMTTASGTTAAVIPLGHHCHVGDLTSSGGGGWAAAFMPSPTGFIHPWSLAARQQKAAAEQDRTPPTSYMPSDDHVATSPLSAVGWPPVHTSRRNIVAAMHITKPAGAITVAVEEDGPHSSMAHARGNSEKNVAALPSTDSKVVATTRPPSANMFAKVHMEGYAIGRKINLRAQRSYDSLSRVLTNITTNFFCAADCSSSAGTSEKDLPNIDKFIFLYEDFEGDRMLVGDVPWELFLASAKRLYIVRKPTSSDKGQGEDDRKYKPKQEQPTND